MTGTSNAITTKVKSPPRLAMKSGDPSQYVCVNGEYIKGTHKRICLMQTQGTPFAAEISSYKQASGNTAASLQSGTSVIPSVKETKAALAKKAEQSGPLYEIPGGRNRQFYVIEYLAKNSKNTENTEINTNICKHSKGTLCENRALSG